MIKLIIKLAIVAVIANATWRVGSTYARHYRFVDAVEQVTQFRATKSDSELHDRVFELASQYDIPVTGDNLTITLQNQHTVGDGSYTQSIGLFPGFKYAWPFRSRRRVRDGRAAPPPSRR